jgi:hypothetical protein
MLVLQFTFIPAFAKVTATVFVPAVVPFPIVSLIRDVSASEHAAAALPMKAVQLALASWPGNMKLLPVNVMVLLM